MDEELLEPYDKLVEIQILGRRFEVPENNLLLRQMQYLSDDIGMGRYCWNAECRYCEFEYQREGSTQGGLACRVKAPQGMKITKLAGEMRYNMDAVLSATPVSED